MPRWDHDGFPLAGSNSASIGNDQIGETLDGICARVQSFMEVQEDISQAGRMVVDSQPAINDNSLANSTGSGRRNRETTHAEF
jgi:hypothetical protein